jgi:hypothetical protein
MSEVDNLLSNYRQFVAMPWQENIAGAQKVWFAVYDPTQERRIRLRLDEFQIATKAAGQKWRLLDLSDSFATWMAGHRYREAYFDSPEDLGLALNDFTDYVVQQLREALTETQVDEDTVVAVLGVATLFGLTRASTVIEKAASDIQGRLLLFFPGQHEGGNYRLLDARDGWNYLAIPITG